MRGLVAMLLLLLAPSASAQPAVSPVERERARAHFLRGLDRFNEERYDQALAEFEAAYDIAPAAPVLYNLARVHDRQGNAVAAADSYERYLAEAEDVRPRRRREVEEALAALAGRIGLVVVETNVEGATISINGVDRATTPLREPLRVNAGQVLVGARAPGYQEANAERLVAGERIASLSLELERSIVDRGILDIRSIPGVEVFLDGDRLGITPLDESRVSTSAGPHRVTGRRRGYRGQPIEVTAVANGTRPVELVMEIDPAADDRDFGAVELAQAPEFARYSLNGQELAAADLERVPVGRHEFEVRAPGREAAREQIVVRSGETTRVALSFRATDDRLGQLEEQGSTFRIVGTIFLSLGAAFAITTLVAGVLAATSLPDDHDARREMIERCEDNRMVGDCVGWPVESMREQFNNDVDAHNLQLAITWIGAGAAVATLGAGVIFHVLAPSVGGSDVGFSVAPTMDGFQIFGQF
ncbi:MAG: PEGA domain-containing protein [Myxococcota bacterium]